MKIMFLSAASALVISLGCSQYAQDPVAPNTGSSERTKLKPDASEDTALQGLISCSKSVVTIGMPATTAVDDAQARNKTDIRTDCRIADLRDSDGEVAASMASISSSEVACQDLLDSTSNRTNVSIENGKKIKIQIQLYFRELVDVLPDQCPVTVSVKDANGRELSEKKGLFTIAKTTQERRLALLAPREISVVSSADTTDDSVSQQLFVVEVVSPDKDYNYDISDHVEDYECADDAACEDIGISVVGRNGIVAIDRKKAHVFLGGASQKIAKIQIEGGTNEGFTLHTREIKIIINSALFVPQIAEDAGTLTCTLAADSSEKTSRTFSFEARRDNLSSYLSLADGATYVSTEADKLRQIRCVVIADKSDAGFSAAAKLTSSPFSLIDLVVLEKFKDSYQDENGTALEGIALMKIRGRGQGLAVAHPMDPRNSGRIGLEDASGSFLTEGEKVNFNLIGPDGSEGSEVGIPSLSGSQLGNVLFSDPQMSTRGTGPNHGNYGEDEDDNSDRATWSCATCHAFEYAYGGARFQSIGAGGVAFADNRIADPDLDLENPSHIDAPPVRSPMVANVAANAGGMFHNQRAGGRRDCGEASIIEPWGTSGLADENEGSQGLPDPKSRHSAYSAERKCPNTNNIDQWITAGENFDSMKLGLLGFEGVEQQAMMAIGEHRFSVNGNTFDDDLTLYRVQASEDQDLKHWAQKRAWQRTTAEIESAFGKVPFEKLLELPAGSLMVGCNGRGESFTLGNQGIQGITPQDRLCTLGEIIQCDGRVGALDADKNACPTGYLVTEGPGKLKVDDDSGAIEVKSIEIKFALRGDKASGLTANGRRVEDGIEGEQDELVNETLGQFKRKIKVALIISQWERMAVTSQALFQSYIGELIKVEGGSATADLGKDLSHKAKRGAVVFLNSCTNCHNGQDLGGDVSSEVNFGLADLQEFFADKEDIPHIGPVGTRTLIGRAAATGKSEDRWKKKAPTLYNLQDHPAMGHGSTMGSIKDIITYKVAVLNDKTKHQKTTAELAAADINLDEYRGSIVTTGTGPGDAPASMRDLTADQIDDVSYFVKTALQDSGMSRFNFAKAKNALPAELRVAGAADVAGQVSNPFICPENDDDESRFQLGDVRSRDGNTLRECIGTRGNDEGETRAKAIRDAAAN